ncbi:hypothetical protein C8J57DRAFT_1080530, partial [Mycena rebaudengoi]
GIFNIGTGRIVWQDIVRIDVSNKKRKLHKNIFNCFKHGREGNGDLHLVNIGKFYSSSSNPFQKRAFHLMRIFTIHLDLRWQRALPHHGPPPAFRDREGAPTALCRRLQPTPTPFDGEGGVRRDARECSGARISIVLDPRKKIIKKKNTSPEGR